MPRDRKPPKEPPTERKLEMDMAVVEAYGIWLAVVVVAMRYPTVRGYEDVARIEVPSNHVRVLDICELAFVPPEAIGRAVVRERAFAVRVVPLKVRLAESWSMPPVPAYVTLLAVRPLTVIAVVEAYGKIEA